MVPLERLIRWLASTDDDFALDSAEALGEIPLARLSLRELADLPLPPEASTAGPSCPRQAENRPASAP